jgi:hypothetical protein
VVKGVYKKIGVESPQSVAGSEASAGAANLTLAATFGDFTLSASAHSTAAVGGLPGAAVGVPFATEHPVNTEIIKSMTIRRRQ